MNSANLCPCFQAVADKVAALTRVEDYDVSFNNRAQFNDTLKTSRARVAAQIGAAPDEVALVRNTSEGNSVITNGLNFREGDEVVIWEQNHVTNNQAWDIRAKRFGLKIIRVAVPRIPESAEQVVGLFAQACSDRTKILSFTEVSNVSGLKLPAKELAAMARQRGIHCHVDGAQSWGAAVLNMHDIGCDSFAASGHKWFMGPKEVGILYVRAGRAPDIWPNTIGYTGDIKVELELETALKFETLGQRDDAAIAALGDTADLHEPDRTGTDSGPHHRAGDAPEDWLEGCGCHPRNAGRPRLERRRGHHRGAESEPGGRCRRDVHKVRHSGLDVGWPAALPAHLQYPRACRACHQRCRFDGRSDQDLSAKAASGRRQ